MSACAVVAPWLPGFVGGDLAVERLELVREHLRDCTGCRREAASFLQANKALQAAAVAAAVEVGDDDLHDEIHATVMARVEVEAERADEPVAWPHRLLLTAAAVLLAAFGYWLAAETRAPSIWDREPMTAPDSDPVLRAVPWAGPRLDLMPVGLDPADYGGSAANGYGPGMMGRGQLRTNFGDEEFVLPTVHRKLR